MSDHADMHVAMSAFFEHELCGRATRHWQAECQAMEQANVYRELANLILLTRGEVCLDLCSGTCPMEREIIRRQPAARFLAVEANLHALDASVLQLRSAKIPAHLFRGADADDVWLDQHANSRGVHYRRSKGELVDQVLLVPRDLQHADEEIENILRGERASLTLFTFPGSHPVLAMQDRRPVAAPEPSNEGNRQLANTVYDAWACATKFTKTGGKILRADRAHVAAGCDDALLRCLLHSFEARLQPFWEMWEAPCYLNADVSHIPTGGRTDAPPFRKRIYALQMQRTDVPFQREHFDAIRMLHPPFVSFL